MKPKPLVALNHFTVPMLTGVVPSQVDIVEAHFSGGLVRSNFWKGRQRLNRLHRWIANVVQPKIAFLILFQNKPQNNPARARFLGPQPATEDRAACSRQRSTVSVRNTKLWDLVTLRAFRGSNALSAAELSARGCTARGSATRTLVLVTEY